MTRTRSPSISVTSLARCLSTGSPKMRIVYDTITPRVPTTPRSPARPCLGDRVGRRPHDRPNTLGSDAGWIHRDSKPAEGTRAAEVDVGEAVRELDHRPGAHEGAG